MRLEFSRYVEDDIGSIADFVSQDNSQRAIELVREIWHKILRVAEQPLLYQLRPEIGEGARLAVVGRCLILFRVIGDTVRIERVVYGGRDLPGLFE